MCKKKNPWLAQFETIKIKKKNTYNRIKLCVSVMVGSISIVYYFIIYEVITSGWVGGWVSNPCLKQY